MIDEKLVRYAAQLDSLVPDSKPCANPECPHECQYPAGFGGRPPRYCSNRCRSQFHNKRKRFEELRAELNRLAQRLDECVGEDAQGASTLSLVERLLGRLDWIQADYPPPDNAPDRSPPTIPVDVAIANMSGTPLTLDQALRFHDFIVATRRYNLAHPLDWRIPVYETDPWGRWVREANDGVEPSHEEILAARAESARRARELGT